MNIHKAICNIPFLDFLTNKHMKILNEEQWNRAEKMLQERWIYDWSWVDKSSISVGHYFIYNIGLLDCYLQLKMHLNATKWCSVPNQVVKCQCLLGKCMFSGWTNIVSLHWVVSCERLHRPGPSETALLVRLNWFLWWEMMFFNAVYIRVSSPCSEQGTCFGTLNMKKVKGSSWRRAIWDDGWIRCGFGGAEGWWLQQIGPFLPEHDGRDWEHSWVGLSALTQLSVT